MIDFLSRERLNDKLIAFHDSIICFSHLHVIELLLFKKTQQKAKLAFRAPEDKICSLFMTKSNFLLNVLTDITPNPLMSFDIQSSVMIYC